MTKDSITYEGNSIAELRADFEAGIESYIEGCEAMGVKPRKSFNGVLNVRIPSDIHCRLALLAEDSGTSINAIIRETLEQRLQVAV
ncbi:MAG: type II toxin-antitoxin system HicB family antitoxin [Tannerella sp.]|jgi:predicted HicB family RNase H-like nuclease|nr:type II toxin-antitoxin system HicB family antitoxin [Tannerella sp.]